MDLEQLAGILPMLKVAWDSLFNLLVIFIILNMTGIWPKLVAIVRRKPSNGSSSPSGNPNQSFSDVFRKLDQIQSDVSKLSGRLDSMDQQMDATSGDVTWLRDIHDKYDEDGVPMWYVRRSMQKAVERMNNMVGELAGGVKVLTEEIHGLVRNR